MEQEKQEEVPWFTDRSVESIIARQSILCLGLDPQIGHIAKLAPDLLTENGLPELAEDDYGPKHWEAMARVFLAYSIRAMEAAGDEVVWVKPQSAFWEACGAWGVSALELAVEHARKLGHIVILDAKRGDGGDTAKAYARTYLGQHSLYDALTIQPYIGEACVAPFVEQIRKTGRCAFVVDKTSFTPNSAVEQLPVVDIDDFKQLVHSVLVDIYTNERAGGDPQSTDQRVDQIVERLKGTSYPAWQRVADMVFRWGKGTEGACGWRNLGVVMGATYPDDTKMMRELLPNTWFLVPGYGAQGGAADEAVLGADQNGFGITVNSSRGLLYPKDGDIAAAARKARLDLNDALRRAGKGGFLKAA